MPLTNELPMVPTETTPDVATATSVEIAAADSKRTYLLVQNNSSANIMISLSGGTLTGIVPSATNKGIVIGVGGNWESAPGNVPKGSITAYQTSGATINTISVVQA